MKKRIILTAFLLLVAALLLSLPAGDPLYAVDGCCKERKSYKSPWAPNGKSYAECKDKNTTDGDNVFQKSGLVWWDTGGCK